MNDRHSSTGSSTTPRSSPSKAEASASKTPTASTTTTSLVTGVRSGLYRLGITGKRGAKGKAIPSQYNTETTLGLAVGGLPGPQTRTINLE